MKRNKKKLILVLLGVFVCGIVGAYFGAREFRRHQIDGWGIEGIAASKAGDHEKAADLLSRYLRRRPDSELTPEALSHYIVSREKAEMPNGQHLAETIAALKMLLGLQPDRIDDRRHLLELYARLERRPEAIDTANLILEKNDKDVRTLEIKTEVLTKMGRDREALEVAERWSQVDPAALTPLMSRIMLRQRIGHDPAVIVADVQQQRQAHPGDPRFELLQGVAYIETGDYPQAGQWLKAAAAHDNLNDELARHLIEQFERAGLRDESLELLKQRVASTGDAELRAWLARRLWEIARWDELVEVLASVDAADRASDAMLVAFKAIALANVDKRDESNACRAALADKGAAGRAWSLLLRRLIDASAVDEKQVIEECRNALLTEPNNVYLTYYLGDAHERNGDQDIAIDLWRRAAAKNTTWVVPSVRLVEALLQRGRPEEAMAIASFAARRNPTQAAAVITLARAWAASVESGQMAHADELFKLVTEVQKQLPLEESTLVIRAQMLAQRQNKPEDAIELVRQAINKQPPLQEQTLISLASLSMRAKLGIEDECFATSEKAHGATPALAYAMAMQKSLAGDPNGGLAHLDEMAKRSGQADSAEWRVARARYLDAIGHTDAATAWVSLGDAFPNNLTVQQAAVKARAPGADWEFAQRTIDRLKQLTGEKGLAWRIAQARLYVEGARDAADYERGSVLLNEILRDEPESIDARVLLARALVQMKRIDGAIEHLRVAASLDRTSVPIALQLAALMQSRGDFEKVNEELARIAPQLKTSEQRRNAAMLLAQQGKQDQAIDLLQQPSAATNASASPDRKPATGGDDLLLAILYRQQRQFNKAEQVVQRLLNTDKVDVATVQFATSLYTSQGRRADAERALTHLDKIQLEPGIKQMAWGAFHAQMGELTEAAKRYAEASREAPQNPVPWRMMALCQVASGQAQAAIDTFAAAARSVPADKGLTILNQNAQLLATAATSDPNLTPVVLNVIRTPENVEPALALLNTVVELRPTHDMERMAARLQQLVERHGEFLPNRLQLVQCYWDMGRPTDAISAAQQAMTAFPSAAEPPQLLTRLYEATARWADMRTAAQAWKSRAPQSAQQADITAARADIAQKQYDSAAKLIEPYVDAAMANPDANSDLFTIYSIALVNTGMERAAVDLLWPQVERSIAWRTVWVMVAQEVQDLSVSQAWLDKLDATIPPTDVDGGVLIAECYERLADRTGDPATAKRATDRFAQLVAQPHVSPIALLAAAAHAERRKALVEAEELYRRALVAAPNLWVAQNNLAMILSQRRADVAEAIKLATTAVASQPRQAAVHDTLGQVQAVSGNYRAAADSMNTAIRLQPDNPVWRVRLAKYLLDAGDPIEASKAIAALEDRRLDVRSLPDDLRNELQQLREKLRGAAASSDRG